MESTASSTPRKRKAPSSTKVKVVASRYAQTIQRTNLDAKSERSGRAPVASSSSNAASIKVGSSRAVTSKTAAQTRTGVVSSSGTRTPAPSTPAVASGNSAGGSSSDSNGTMSISDKLRLYRANKAAQRPGSAAATTSRSVTADAADPFRSTAPRPTLPERITPPTEKAPPRLSSRDRVAVSGASTPVKRRMTTPTGRTTPSKTTSSFLSKPPAVTVSTVAASRVPTSTTEEELELLECMYLQLCFSEATAAASFRRQEQSAERQMITAWTILQSKLQLLHDTTIRLDREVHIRSVEDRLDDQAEALVRLGSVIASFVADLDHITSALEASLQRMPTPGVVCSPPELKRQLESLSLTLQAFQNQLQSDGTGSTIADALSFTQGMEDATEQICALLLQVGHLLEEIQLEVNTETSLKAHWIQDARVQQQTRTPDWW